MTSPKILKLHWGSIELEKNGDDGTTLPGESVTYRDAILWPGGSKLWDWNENGTSHWYGITPEDVRELKVTGTKFIVLTRGQWSFLHVPPSLIEDLETEGFDVIVEKSGLAVEKYNDLVKRGEPVAGLFHTTC